MNRNHRLREHKIRASRLLKSLNSTTAGEALTTAARFKSLYVFAGLLPEGILEHRQKIRLKDALMVIALEQGCTSWTELKRRIVSEDCLYKQGCGGLNAWYTDYETAKTHLQKETGLYLLQYRQYYVVCQQDYIDDLGLAHLAFEWRRIGYNWVEPADMEAWKILWKEATINYLHDL